MEAFAQGRCTAPGDAGLFGRLAYHLVFNNFTDPQSLEGLKIESFAPCVNGVHETTAMLRSIATGTKIAEDIRTCEAAARTTKFRWTACSVKMVNAWEVTEHWDKHYLHRAWKRVESKFTALGISFKTTLPRAAVAQLARA